MHREVWQEVGDRIQSPDDACQFLSEAMQLCANKTFNGLATLHFTNSTGQIQDSVVKFCASCRQQFDLKAIYLEMNGFDINTDRWYFDFFGYEASPPSDDSIDWLSDWQSPDFPDVTLTGLESIQTSYERYMEENSRLNLSEHDQELDYNRELATLMVMAKFCKLIDECLDATKLSQKQDHHEHLELVIGRPVLCRITLDFRRDAKIP